MKRYVRANETKSYSSSRSQGWQNELTEEVYTRLCECRSTKRDIVPLTQAFYKYSPKVQEQGMSAQDALEYILMWVLDWNGATWDYSDEEYQKWLSQIK